MCILGHHRWCKHQLGSMQASIMKNQLRLFTCYVKIYLSKSSSKIKNKIRFKFRFFFSFASLWREFSNELHKQHETRLIDILSSVAAVFAAAYTIDRPQTDKHTVQIGKLERRAEVSRSRRFCDVGN